VFRYEKEIFEPQWRSGKTERASVMVLGLRVLAKEIPASSYGRVEYVRELELTASQMVM